MRTKIFLMIIALITTVSLFSFITGKHKPDIPRVWDVEQLQSMHLPYPDPTGKLGFITEEQYNQLRERECYKTYPFYMPGTEPPGYYDSLSALEPVINFRQEDLQSEEDWTRAGEIVYDMPMNFVTLDSGIRSLLPVMAKRWKEVGIHGNKNGIIPFVSIVIRQKGKIELGSESCGMCHTKEMPDGQLFKGAQGNFVGDPFRNIVTTTSRGWVNAPVEEKFKQFYIFNQRLFYTPWVHNEYQKNYEDLKAEDLDKAFHGIVPGVQTRGGTSFDHPVSIPDLYNLQERKYLDKTGHNQQRDIGDLMRYATLNQNLSFSTSYGGFIPHSEPNPTNPVDYRNVGRFSDAQLYALAKYLYTLKPVPNPNKASPDLIRKGKTIFYDEGCDNCHTPPLYTNNSLTPVDGFQPPADHLSKYKIYNESVGTDPGLSLYTRRASGYYKVPSLIGAWNRTAFLHNGHLATLEDLFDKTRLSPGFKPTHFKPRGMDHMAVNGHPYGLDITPDEKEALVAFIKSL